MEKVKKGRVVVVTGASAGVGRATVRAFAREGEHIGLLARDTEGLHVAAQEVGELGGRGLAVPTDVSDADQVEAAAARIESELGPIEVWVNNAMTTVFARVMDVTPAEFKRATEVTYLGTVYGTMAALRRMAPRNMGRIIQVGSALAYRSIPLQSAYCGAKHAIAGFTDSLRTELIHDGKNIHLTMVQLPAMNTPQFTWCRSKCLATPARSPDLSAGGSGRADRLGVSSQAPRGVRGSAHGRTGFDSQQTREPVPPDRRDNLFEPLPGDFGAHGVFGEAAHDEAATTWLATHKGATALAGAACVGLLALACLIKRAHLQTHWWLPGLEPSKLGETSRRTI